MNHQFGPGKLKTCLFVDFDNVYSILSSASFKAAEAFATRPLSWLSWFEAGHHRGDGEARPCEILMRRCYLNPNRFGAHRRNFTYSGFQTIDCPPLTGMGKNSADIWMVLDIIEALDHSTRFDEFLILSADADFTPVLLRLREHNRQTAILSTVMTSGALKAAAGSIFDVDTLAAVALGETPAYYSAATDNADQISQPAAETAPTSRDQILRTEILDLVAEQLRGADRPLHGSIVGEMILEQFGMAVKEDGWLGAGSLNGLISSAARPDMAAIGNMVYDPQRHQVDTTQIKTDPSDMAGLSAALLDLIDRLSAVGWPRLAPVQIDVMIREMVRLIGTGIVERNALSPAVRDAIKDQIEANTVPKEHFVSRSAINYMLTGLLFKGAVFGQNCKTETDIRHLLRAIATDLLESRVNTTTDADPGLDRRTARPAPGRKRRAAPCTGKQPSLRNHRGQHRTGIGAGILSVSDERPVAARRGHRPLPAPKASTCASPLAVISRIHVRP